MPARLHGAEHESGDDIILPSPKGGRIVQVLSRARDLVAAGGVTLVEAVRAATPFTRERLEAYREYLRVRLTDEEPAVAALDAAIADLAGPHVREAGCAYCGRELGDYHVGSDGWVTAPFGMLPGVFGSFAVCDECCHAAAMDSPDLLAYVSSRH